MSKKSHKKEPDLGRNEGDASEKFAPVNEEVVALDTEKTPAGEEKPVQLSQKTDAEKPQPKVLKVQRRAGTVQAVQYTGQNAPELVVFYNSRSVQEEAGALSLHPDVKQAAKVLREAYEKAEADEREGKLPEGFNAWEATIEAFSKTRAQRISIQEFDGIKQARPGDYVVKTAKGDFEVYQKDQFEDAFETVEEITDATPKDAITSEDLAPHPAPVPDTAHDAEREEKKIERETL